MHSIALVPLLLLVACSSGSRGAASVQPQPGSPHALEGTWTQLTPTLPIDWFGREIPAPLRVDVDVAGYVVSVDGVPFADRDRLRRHLLPGPDFEDGELLVVQDVKPRTTRLDVFWHHPTNGGSARFEFVLSVDNRGVVTGMWGYAVNFLEGIWKFPRTWTGDSPVLIYH